MVDVRRYCGHSFAGECLEGGMIFWSRNVHCELDGEKKRIEMEIYFAPIKSVIGICFLL